MILMSGRKVRHTGTGTEITGRRVYRGTAGDPRTEKPSRPGDRIRRSKGSFLFAGQRGDTPALMSPRGTKPMDAREQYRAFLLSLPVDERRKMLGLSDAPSGAQVRRAVRTRQGRANGR